MARILGRYCQGREEPEVEVMLRRHDPSGEVLEEEKVSVAPFASRDIKAYRIQA